MTKTSEEKLREIYDETYNDLLAYIISKCSDIDEAYDIVQNTYFNMYKALDKRDILKPKQYLFRIARNEIYKVYGVLATLRRHIPIFSSKSEDVEFNADEALIIRESFDVGLICDEIYEKLKQGDDLTFNIFTMYFKYDLKIREISKYLNISDSIVKNRLYRTLKELRSDFEVRGELI